VPEQHAPVLWLGQVAVVSLPVEIDLANAGQIREDLLTVLNRGPATLIVDMTGTTFCDSAGVNAIVRAYKRAAAGGARMRLVVSAPAVQRVLAITGVDRLIGTWPSVAAALTAVDEPAPGEPPHPGYATRQTDPGGWAAQPG
jgi:anti-sigma B factor antagonist